MNPNTTVTLMDATLATKEQVEAALIVLHKLGTLNQEIAGLIADENRLRHRPRCCGRILFQNDGRPYAVHSLNDQCPYPGHETRPTDTRGRRCYINQVDKEAVVLAMKTWSQWQSTNNRLGKKRRSLISLESAMNIATNQAKGR